MKLFRIPLMFRRKRVFGIGLGRTGTVSLTSALNTLGYKTLHYPHDERTYEELRRGDPKLTVLGEYDGITDIPAAMMYKKFAAAYPQARFVLTVRDEEPWLRSIERHWSRFPSLPSDPSSGEPDHRYALRRLTRSTVFGLNAFDAELLPLRRAEYHRDVKKFFADQPERLLELDICGGDGWEPLCNFLDKPVPDQDFPCLHQSDFDAPPTPED